MADKVPICYRVMIQRIRDQSYNGKILTERVRSTLMNTFRMPRSEILGIMRELKELDLIELHNHRFIWIK